MNEKSKEDYGEIFRNYTKISENFSESSKDKKSNKTSNKKKMMKIKFSEILF